MKIILKIFYRSLSRFWEFSPKRCKIICAAHHQTKIKKYRVEQVLGWTQGRIQEFILGGQTKFSNRKLRAKPESRARSARESRAKPELKARSAWELRAKPEPMAKPEKKRGRGLGRGLGEPLSRKFLKNRTWNHLGVIHILRTQKNARFLPPVALRTFSYPLPLCVRTHESRPPPPRIIGDHMG